MAKKDNRTAAHYADAFFNLKDAITTTLEFQKKNEKYKYHALQQQQTERAVAKLRFDSIPLQTNKKYLILIALLTLCACSLAFIPPSEKVMAQLRKEEEMRQRTTEIQRETQKAVEHLIADLTEDEKALINPDELRKYQATPQRTPSHAEHCPCQATYSETINWLKKS